jgi:dTDP-4-amino-4,6-dideoxygalactose transaminase
MHCRARQLLGHASGAEKLVPADAGTTLLLHRGRTAVWWAAKLLGLVPGDEVLVPAYHCGSEIDPLVHYGLTVRAYDIRDDLTVDVDKVAARVTPRTRAVYVIHYFGLAQSLGDLATWCKARGLMLVEDCAVALLAEDPDGPVGRTGDAAIFSFRKTLPVPDGGALRLRKRADLEHVRLRPPPARANRLALAKLLGGSVRARMPSWIHGAVTRDPAAQSPPANAGGSVAPLAAADRFDHRLIPWAMSCLSRRIAGSVDPDEVRRRRRQNYRRLIDALPPAHGLRPLLPDLPEGACPVVCPLVGNDRDQLYRYLRARRIAAIPFWAGGHEAVDWSEHPAAARWKQSVVALPVHQMLEDRHIDCMADCLRRYACQETGTGAPADVVTMQ